MTAFELECSEDELDRFVTRRVEDLIRQKVFTYLEFKLQGAIEAFVAGQRLTDPNAISLEVAMTKALEKVIEKEVKKQLADKFAKMSKQV